MVETKEAEINYEAPEAVEVVSVREEEPLNNYGAVVPQQFAAAQIVEVRQPGVNVTKLFTAVSYDCSCFLSLTSLSSLV